MPNYLILIYRDEELAAEEVASQAAGGDVGSPYVAFMERHASSLRGGAGLEPSSTATSLRSDDNGGFTVTDGPFAETKEVLGGYYVVEAADLDAALAIAKEVPAAFGGVEVRPIWMQS